MNNLIYNYEKSSHDEGWIVTYDNGTGFREWACSPQATKEEAMRASNWDGQSESFLGSDDRFEYHVGKYWHPDQDTLIPTNKK
jgi:hypothetical protein